MSWIGVVDENAATGRLAALYAQLIDADSGRVDNVLKIHSLAVRGMEAHLALYKHAMAPTPTLPKAEREMIAVVVSVINGCHY